MGSVRTVVFVCQHGAAKSMLAAALLEHLAQGWRVISFDHRGA